MLTLYDYLPSQNAWKVRLLLNQLERPYRTELISIFEGEGQREEFLRVSPAGKVPAIRLDNGAVLAESNAILYFLAQGSRYLPEDGFTRARVVQWLCYEADYVQNSVATLRHWVLTGKAARRPPELIESKRQGSMSVLGVLERTLRAQPFLAGSDYTIADIAVFAYVHLAEDAQLPLHDFPALTRWLAAVREQPRFLDRVYPYSIDPHSSGELPA